MFSQKEINALKKFSPKAKKKTAQENTPLEKVLLNAQAVREYYQNNGDTSVFNITKMQASIPTKSFLTMLQVMSSDQGNNKYPDEVSIEKSGSKKYLRLWWD